MEREQLLVELDKIKDVFTIDDPHDAYSRTALSEAILLLEPDAGAKIACSGGLSDRVDIWHHEREAFKEDIAKAIFSTKPMSEKVDKAQEILSIIDLLELRDE